MRTVRIKVYSFNELDSKARQFAIGVRTKENSENVDLYGWQEVAKWEIEDEGFVNPELQYSLGYSQGDGLSFSADGYKKLSSLFEQVLGTGKEKTAQFLADNCVVAILGNTGNYAYAHASQVNVRFNNWGSRLEEVADKVQELLADKYLNHEIFYPKYC